jgi:hypothetical protein
VKPIKVEDAPRIEVASIIKLLRAADIKSRRRVCLLVNEHAYTIRLDETRLTFGSRFWFLCPGCGLRRRVLHLLDGILACRGCFGLRYWRQARHRNRTYERVVKPAMNMRKIEIKLSKQMKCTKRRSLERSLTETAKRPRCSSEIKIEGMSSR